MKPVKTHYYPKRRTFSNGGQLYRASACGLAFTSPANADAAEDPSGATCQHCRIAGGLVPRRKSRADRLEERIAALEERLAKLERSSPTEPRSEEAGLGGGS